MNIYSIYCIANKINNKKYIGKTGQRMQARFNNHLSCARNNKYPQNYFHNSLLKYGKDCFELSILETIIDDENLAYEREKFWITSLKTISPHGYNSHEGGRGGSSNPSNDLRNRLSKARKGVSPWNKGKKYAIILTTKFNKMCNKKRLNKCLIIVTQTPKKACRLRIARKFNVQSSRTYKIQYNKGKIYTISKKFNKKSLSSNIIRNTWYRVMFISDEIEIVQGLKVLSSRGYKYSNMSNLLNGKIKRYKDIAKIERL